MAGSSRDAAIIAVADEDEEQQQQLQQQSRGAGGKITKRSLRSRVPSTPYSRPPQPPRPEAAENRREGWFSKLVVKPASRLLPSLFSTRQDQDQDQELVSEIEQQSATVSAHTLENQSFEPKESGASEKTRQPIVDSKGAGFAGHTFNDHGIADIEQQLQQKKFSREEIEHLIKLMRSRTTDLPDDKGHPTGITDASELMPGQKDLRTPTNENNGVQFDCRMTQKPFDHTEPKANDVGSSPVEIAKAYMESQTSVSGFDSQTGRLKNEKNIPCTPIAKTPICWPGAIMQNDPNYSTPRRGSVAHHTLTPYSRDLFSKSTSKFKANAERPNHSSAWQSSTPVFGRNKTTMRASSVSRNGFAPVSPLHHMSQRNVATTSRGAGPSTSTASFTSLSKSDVSGGFSLAIGRDDSLKNGLYNKVQKADKDEASVFATGSTPGHPHSSVMARKILQQLDRSVPSPREKLLEISMARKKVPNSETVGKLDQHDKSDAGNSNEQKAGFLLGENLVSKDSTNAQKELLRKSSRPSSIQTGKQGVQGTFASSLAFRMPENSVNSAMLQPPEGLSKSSHETSVPTSQPSEKHKGCENGFTFTFPIPATQVAFSEPPPTPTMASSPGSKLDAVEGSIPSFSFGSPTNSSDRLVFSFGSAVSSSDVGISTPSFKFGAEKKSSLTFKSIGSDAVFC